MLKRGGRFLCLEFSTGRPAGARPVLPALLRPGDPADGQRSSTGDRESYQYLVESIRKFPAPAEFSAMIARAGFKRVDHTAFSGNIAALHGAWKI